MSRYFKLSLLSPVPEAEENASTNTLHDNTEVAPFISSEGSTNSQESPSESLPDLIIEVENKYPHDEPKEFYDKLQKSMRKLYRKRILKIDDETCSMDSIVERYEAEFHSDDNESLFERSFGEMEPIAFDGPVDATGRLIIERTIDERIVHSSPEGNNFSKNLLPSRTFRDAKGKDHDHSAKQRIYYSPLEDSSSAEVPALLDRFENISNDDNADNHYDSKAGEGDENNSYCSSEEDDQSSADRDAEITDHNTDDHDDARTGEKTNNSPEEEIRASSDIAEEVSDDEISYDYTDNSNDNNAREVEGEKINTTKSPGRDNQTTLSSDTKTKDDDEEKEEGEEEEEDEEEGEESEENNNNSSPDEEDPARLDRVAAISDDFDDTDVPEAHDDTAEENDTQSKQNGSPGELDQDDANRLAENSDASKDANATTSIDVKTLEAMRRQRPSRLTDIFPTKRAKYPDSYDFTPPTPKSSRVNDPVEDISFSLETRRQSVLLSSNIGLEDISFSPKQGREDVPFSSDSQQETFIDAKTKDDDEEKEEEEQDEDDEEEEEEEEEESEESNNNGSLDEEDPARLDRVAAISDDFDDTDRTEDHDETAEENDSESKQNESPGEMDQDYANRLAENSDASKEVDATTSTDVKTPEAMRRQRRSRLTDTFPTKRAKYPDSYDFTPPTPKSSRVNDSVEDISFSLDTRRQSVLLSSNIGLEDISFSPKQGREDVPFSSDSQQELLLLVSEAEENVSPSSSYGSTEVTPVIPIEDRTNSQESPSESLPELIIEVEKKYPHDESKEFYDKLERSMTKLYRKRILKIDEETFSVDSIVQKYEDEFISDNDETYTSPEEFDRAISTKVADIDDAHDHDDAEEGKESEEVSKKGNYYGSLVKKNQNGADILAENTDASKADSMTSAGVETPEARKRRRCSSVAYTPTKRTKYRDSQDVTSSTPQSSTFVLESVDVNDPFDFTTDSEDFKFSPIKRCPDVALSPIEGQEHVPTSPNADREDAPFSLTVGRVCVSPCFPIVRRESSRQS